MRPQLKLSAAHTYATYVHAFGPAFRSKSRHLREAARDQMTANGSRTCRATNRMSVAHHAVDQLFSRVRNLRAPVAEALCGGVESRVALAASPFVWDWLVWEVQNAESALHRSLDDYGQEVVDFLPIRYPIIVVRALLSVEGVNICTMLDWGHGSLREREGVAAFLADFIGSDPNTHAGAVEFLGSYSKSILG